MLPGCCPNPTRPTVKCIYEPQPRKYIKQNKKRDGLDARIALRERVHRRAQRHRSRVLNGNGRLFRSSSFSSFLLPIILSHSRSSSLLCSPTLTFPYCFVTNSGKPPPERDGRVSAFKRKSASQTRSKASEKKSTVVVCFVVFVCFAMFFLRRVGVCVRCFLERKTQICKKNIF